jgi:EAL domain-containing protein (putative c-di-GMP-specific phosphodiesterase class I)
LGVKLSVDDFGTGYSSLAQLHQLDVDVLKVDKAFTDQLGKGKEGELLFRAIVSMAEALHISVVAEGVETPEQLAALKSLNCDEVQGFLVSKALPPTDIPPLMEKRFLFKVPAAS